MAVAVERSACLYGYLCSGLTLTRECSGQECKQEACGRNRFHGDVRSLGFDGLFLRVPVVSIGMRVGCACLWFEATRRGIPARNAVILTKTAKGERRDK